MTFRTYQECSGNGCPYYVLAQGVITASTPREFREFLKKEEYQPIVYFDSPGGNLLAGLELGKLIRARGLDTFVGGPYEAFQTGEGNREQTLKLTTRGICFSACAYAFLGGVSRELAEPGLYGVHQFYSNKRPLGDASTQVAMTVLASYLDEMGVDRRLLDVASVTSSKRMASLSIDIARRLRVDNTEPPLESWAIDTTVNGQLYAYVVQHQPRRDATVSFLITSIGSDLIGTVIYKIQQKFRSAQELDDIFHEQSKEFSMELRSAKIANIEADVVSDWKGRSRDGYVLRVKLDSRTVRAMLSQNSFEFDPAFPRAYSDVSPQVTFSSEKLRQCLIALTK